MTDDEQTPEHEGTLSSDPMAAPSYESITRGSRQRRRAFEPGLVVGKRYRVVRFLAAGGIGEVYEAEDLELGGRVALKILRAGQDANETSAARFRREVQLARRVTHPNVCRTFDSFTHKVTDDDGVKIARLLVVSMELLEGEPLADRIARDGALPVDEALPIVRQIVSGLGAAHESGVIHRDLKARNIFLVPGSDGPRAVITDFGLARSSDGGTSDPTLTDDGALVGTPAYMAPEQILGKDVTTASDIYSLGVVLYEMATAERPFGGGTAISIAVQRLKGPPRSPATVRAGLPRNWEEVILRCLEIEPAARYASAGEVLDALEGRAVARPRIRPRNKTVRRQVLDRVAVVLVVLITLLFAGMAVSRFVDGRSEEEVTPATVPTIVARRSVAIIPLVSLSGDDDGRIASLTMTELLRVEIGVADSLRLVPAEDVVRASLELGLSDESPQRRDAVHSLRRRLGADLTLEGSFLRVPGSEDTRVDVRVVDAVSNEVLAAFSEAASEEELSGMCSRFGERLRSYLGAPPLEGREEEALQAAHLHRKDVLALYAEGVRALHAFDAQRATRLLGEVVRLEPSFGPAHAALSDSWLKLGMSREAQSSARAAVDLSGKLSTVDRLANEGRLAAVTGNWDRAIEIRTAMFRFYPDDPALGLELAETQIAAGRLTDAGATLESIGKLPGVAAGEPRVAILDAEIARRETDHEAMARRARQAIEGAREAGSGHLVARGELLLAEALRETGEHDEARILLAEAGQIFESIGDRQQAAEATALLGSIDYYTGRYGEAESELEIAVGAFLDVGAVGRAARVANVAGGVPFVEGRLRDAEASMRRANALAKQAGDVQLDLASLINLSQIREMSGYGDEAVALAEGLASEAKVAGSEFLEAASLFALGRAELCRGKVSRARDVLREAHAVLRAKGSSRYDGMVLVAMGEVELQAADLDAAGHSLARSLEISEKLDDRAMISESRTLLGEVALARGDLDEAETQALAALRVVNGGISPPMERGARDLLARVLLAKGDLPGAKRVLDRVDSSVEENPHLRIAISRTRAMILAGGGEREAALLLLRDAETEATRFGIVPERLEAQLAAAKIELDGSPTDEATLQGLGMIETEAKRLGFELVARQASQLRGTRPARGGV